MTHPPLVPNLIATPGIHETRLRDRFGDRFAFDGTAPEFSGPLVLLGFFNRSGSNVLGRHLKGTRGFGGFTEQLNHPVVGTVSDRQGLSSFPDYFRSIQAKHLHRPRHIHGFKASWDQVLMLKRARIDRMYDGMRLVHILRADLVAQAVSLVIARQTQQWTSEQEARTEVEPVYDAAQIAQAVQACAEAETRMRMLAEILGLPYLRVTYEDLDRDPIPVMQTVGQFVGRDLSGWTPEPLPIKRQATGRNEAWRARYLAETAQALTCPGPVEA